MGYITRLIQGLLKTKKEWWDSNPHFRKKRCSSIKLLHFVPLQDSFED